jgi:hypothetical protein
MAAIKAETSIAAKYLRQQDNLGVSLPAGMRISSLSTATRCGTREKYGS